MSEFKEFLKGLTQREREDMGRECGMTGAYITSLIYKKGVSTSVPLAVAIDKMSKGRIDMRTLVPRAADVDWDYVKRVLNERPPVVVVDNTSEDCQNPA